MPDTLLNMSHPHSNDLNSGHVTNANPNNEQQTSDKTIKLFYRNQMTSCYKQTEKELQKIIRDNIKPSENTSNIKLRIYYKNRKLKNLFIKNNPNKPKDPFNVV